MMGFENPVSDNKINPSLLQGESPFRNQLLIAMPSLHSDSFIKSVVYICAHNPSGAMGIIINQKMPEVRFGDLLTQLQLPRPELKVDPVVHFGGPVETGRGFVLHSTDFIREDTVKVNHNIGVTGTIDILRAIATGTGPCKSIFALGYAGWGPGQLDNEMKANAWLVVPPDDELVFSPDLSGKWEKAMMKMGVTPAALSTEMGRA
jgi:putative transcriptional regulator